jgi:hypothetical protein
MLLDGLPIHAEFEQAIKQERLRIVRVIASGEGGASCDYRSLLVPDGLAELRKSIESSESGSATAGRSD